MSQPSHKDLLANFDTSTPQSKMDLQHQLALISGYEIKVPDIMTFIDDPYYLGKVLVDSDGNSSVYPIWRDALKKLYPTPYYTSAIEVYLTGGIGLGKSTMAKIITLYDIAKLLSLKNPHQHYSLLPTTIIRYMLMNATKSLSYDVLYAEIIEWIENSPFFKEWLATDKRTLFKKNIDIGFGSRGKDALGQATVGAIFSEINDMTVVHGQSTDVFDTIYTRMNSRFGGKGKAIIGHLILDSSNKGVKSFLDTRLEEKKKNKHDDFVLFRYAHWDAKWHLGQYSGEMFRVFAGDETLDPFIIDDDTDPAIIAGLKRDRVIDVPIEHKSEFQFNILKSIKDLAGLSTFSTWSFINSVELLNSCFDHINPVTKNIIVLDFFDPKQKLIDYINIKALIAHKTTPRFIHVDLGLKNDSTGIACSYLAGYKTVEAYDPSSGNKVINKEPVFFTEWVMEITPVPGHEVAIYKIKDFILEARMMGYPIKSVSTDGYQSSNLRQDLLLRKIETELISVDRTMAPYDVVKNSILEQRLSLPHSEKLAKEFTELEEVDGKYDHPDDGSKDIADAVAGSIWNCSQNLHRIGTLVSEKDLGRGLDALINIATNPTQKFHNKLTGQ